MEKLQFGARMACTLYRPKCERFKLCIYIDEISNPNEWVQITPTLRFQWGYSGHVLGAVWF